MVSSNLVKGYFEKLAAETVLGYGENSRKYFRTRGDFQMNHRYLVVLLALMSVMLLGPAIAAVQAQTDDAEKWTTPSTPWGEPDMQGTFTFRTITPLQRPNALAGKETLDPEEAENFEASENIRRKR